AALAMNSYTKRRKGSKVPVLSSSRRRPALREDDCAEAKACFRRAIEVSRSQQAKSLELRAVMSLGRVWREQGKRDDARNMLGEIYGGFTEGFDTADLIDARELLAQLV